MKKLKRSAFARKIISALMVLVMAIGSLSLIACTRVTDEEATEIVSDLTLRSYNLNVAYYGKGLPCDEELSVGGGYYTVAEDATFRIRNDLIVETRAVFSENVANSLISVYLDGVVSLGVSQYARYITGPDGFLTAKMDYDYVVEEITQYDVSTIEIIKNKKNEIIAEITSVDGAQTIEVVLVYEPEGWRIDSPTY